MRAHPHPKFRAVLAERAHALRDAPTASEQLLWSRLRSQKLGVRFIRQAPVGRFVVDFLAPAASLAVEIDGGYHSRRAAADASRQRKLVRLGFRVLRIEASLVEGDIERAVELVRQALHAS
jgi:crossover junction endodeoxyribonuclease RuvC/BirA family biotin operon repressor/biotin-[acetyl-CoA-carboxylase] ligase